MQDDTSQGTQPQVFITPSLGVTGPHSTSTGSQVSSTDTTSARASRSQTSMVRSMDETEEHEGTSPQEVNLRNRKLRWFQETLKEAKEHVGEPQSLMRERRAPQRFGSYLAMVTNIILSPLLLSRQHTNRSGEMPCRRSMIPLCGMMCRRWCLNQRGSQL